jgi:hypothetical protein
MNKRQFTMSSATRPFLSIIVTSLLLTPSSFAFDTPLSDEAVREAYFLGQRHDESMATLLNNYTKLLPPPVSGPHISSVAFLTPFALLVQQARQRVNYSAQQAAKEHRGEDEMVVINIEILLTQTYPAAISKPTGSRSGSAVGFQMRPSDFWKDFKIRVFDGEKKLPTDSLTGEPIYSCVGDGACDLFGATLHLTLPAKRFTSGSATIEVDPPEGDLVSVDFDLDSLR